MLKYTPTSSYHLVIEGFDLCTQAKGSRRGLAEGNASKKETSLCFCAEDEKSKSCAQKTKYTNEKVRILCRK